MSFTGAGSLLLALFAGAGAAAPAVPAVAATAPAPVALATSPVLNQQASGTWTTTLYLNTASLCPAPSFRLVTTTPAHDDPVTASPKLPACNPAAPASPADPVTGVQLSFKPLAAVPVAATVAITPAQPGVAALSVPVTVHRQVTWDQYAWIPLWSGLGLALLLVLTMLGLRLPDPDADAAAGRARPARMSWKGFWSRPLYAAAAWTFSGSWTTNVTAAGTVIAATLTATGTVAELLPGVELGRFSLLIAVAGGITVAAPLVFGMLNYRFARVDPTTAGVSVITLPAGEPLADIIVPAGATITVPGGADISAEDLPAATTATLGLGATLAVPPGTVITVSTPSGAHSGPALAVPGTSDIAVFGGQQLWVSEGAAVAAASITIGGGHPGDRTLTPGQRIAVPGGAKISFTGRASLRLPEGAQVAAAGTVQDKRSRSSPRLRAPTAYPLPHTSQVVASTMTAMLVASFLTLFGTGAELGILGVLSYLSSAAAGLRVLCVAVTAAAAAIVWFYSVVSIRALADPRPGDAMNASGGTAFML
jgi:hypothetical protein